MKFNPKVIDFLEANKETTLIEFYWSLAWRFFVAIYSMIFFVALVFTVLFSGF